MAGESILIVDDTPVNLKLTRILLVNEGYQVLAASSAEEALELLKTCHPDLVLADVQLPGMDGLELAHRIKQAPETSDILVVALTAYAMLGDEQRALDAGCDGYITKPIDTRTLGNRLREYLNPQSSAPAPAPGPRPAGAPSLMPEADMAELRRTFLAEGLQCSRALLLQLDGHFNPDDAAKPLHQWAGTSALLGYSAIGRLSREAETLLRERPIDQAQLRDRMAALVAAFSNPREARDAPIPIYALEALSGKRVGLIGLPVADQERMAAALERANAIVGIFEIGAGAVPGKLLDCDLVVKQVRAHSPGNSWLSADSHLWNGPPVVLTGSREDLLALPPASRGRAREFLTDSWQPEEALVRLSLALSRPSPAAAPQPREAVLGQPAVLIAGDDPTVVALVRTSLQNFGMDCRTASDGPAALEAIRALRPQAAVLDVAMSGFDGYAVLSAVRAERLPVRVLLLTARRQESDLIRAFRLGADDYVIKPFSSMELVLRLERLLAQ